MSFNRLLQPKINPFGVFIYSPKEGTFDLKTYSDKLISDAELNKYKEEGAYCNSFKDLYISEGKEFWIINNTSFSVKKKKTPIEKKNHSMIFLSFLSGSSKVFLIGGYDKKVFYLDLKKNYFMNWAETNELHIRPALIKIDNYLYILDGVKESKICFERTKLSDDSKSWEKICPSIEQNIILNFPTKNFATATDLNGKIVFLGGDRVTLENNNSYIYDVKNNKITLSSKGTNDNMIFTDKNFYKINNKYSIALSDRLNETKEIALIDKEEQSLIKLNIELPGNDNDNFTFCKYSQNAYKSNKPNIINNTIKNTENPYSQYSYPQRKKRNIEDYTNVQKNYGKATVIIKEEPKEFGYYVSSNSSEEAKSKARRDRIEIIGITEKYDPMKNKQNYQEKSIGNLDKSIKNEEQKGYFKIEVVKNEDELINLEDNNKKYKKHQHKNEEDQYNYQMQYQQDEMKNARGQEKFQQRENLCQECQQKELQKKERLNLCQECQQEEQQKKEWLNLCQECQQEEQQNRKGKGRNIQDNEEKNEAIELHQQIYSEDIKNQYSSEKENKEGSAQKIQINQNQNIVQNTNIEHGEEYNKNHNENVEQIEHHEIRQEQEQNQQNNNEEIKEEENLEINQQLNIEEEKKENIQQEEVHNEQQINIEERNEENIENIQKEEINDENEQNENIEIKQNNQINKEEINQEENIEQNEEAKNEELEKQKNENINKEENLEIQHELDFNNAQMQNENNNENEEDHFTEPGLNNSQEGMNQENEDNIKIQQNVAVENGEDLKYIENEEEQHNEENDEEQQHIENGEEQQYIENVEDQQIENEEEQHIESGEEQYIENCEEKHIENGEEQENIENGEEQENIENGEEQENIENGEEEHIENGEEEMNINNEQEGQIEGQNQENSIHQEGEENQIVGQEYDGEEQEQELDAEGEAYEGEGEEGYEEGEEMHQNDGEEIHQVHHENEEVEYEGEGQAQGEEEEIEREPEEGEVEEQIQERDSLKKTMTQNIGDEVIEISEYPNNIYYDKENFCDYKP